MLPVFGIAHATRRSGPFISLPPSHKVLVMHSKKAVSTMVCCETTMLTPPKTNECPLKRDYFNRKYIFQPLIFRGCWLVFRGVLEWDFRESPPHLGWSQSWRIRGLLGLASDLNTKKYNNLYTWNPNDLYFWRSSPQNKAFSNQNKGHLGSRYNMT